MDIIEIFGLFMSGIVAISLTQKSVVRLRIINLAGSLGFVVYGALITSYPVIALNGFTTIVNIGYLWAMTKPLDHFEILTPKPGEMTFIGHFLKTNWEDILIFNPALNLDNLEKDRNLRFFPILRNGRLVSLVACRLLENQEWEVLLDYALPKYRDLKCGRFFFTQGLKVLGKESDGPPRRFIASADDPAHARYLLNLGFEKSQEEYVLHLGD